MSADLTPRPASAPAGLPRLLAGAPAAGFEPVHAHLERLGRLPRLDDGARDTFLAEVERAGLLGRGGAGFPTARKLRAVAAGRRPVVVANGAEGEPAAGKDALLLRSVPHLVLDGLQLAARAVGARSAYLAVHRGSSSAQGVVRRAVAERQAVGLDEVEVSVVTVANRFLSGEESALVNAVDGGPAVPRSTPPRVFEKGVAGRPTLVQNVETLAHLALIARYGSRWFRRIGTADEPGSFLATVSGAVRRPAVVEVAFGTSIREVIAAAGGVSQRVQAFLLGGYHGSWAPARIADLPMTRADLREAGASLGAGVVVAVPAGACALRETARVARYLADEGAQQCGPCLNGLPAIASTLERLADGSGGATARAALERYAGMVAGRGACHHPDGVVRLVRSALTVFKADVARHEAGRACPPRPPVLPLPAVREVDR